MLGENISPWVNDETVTESLAFTRVRADLSRGNHPGQVFHGPGLQQGVPVRAACRYGKSGRHGENFGSCFSQVSVQFGKAQVITDRDAQRKAVSGHGKRAVPRCNIARLLIGLLG